MSASSCDGPKGHLNDSLSSGERNGSRLNPAFWRGVAGPQRGSFENRGILWKQEPEMVTAQYFKFEKLLEVSQVSWGTTPCENQSRPT